MSRIVPILPPQGSNQPASPATKEQKAHIFATTGSITKSGNNCTITLTSTPPSDFTSSDILDFTGLGSGVTGAQQCRRVRGWLYRARQPTGYAAGWNALTIATNTSANNSGNSFNYNPPTSGTPANFDALTNWS